MNNKKIKSKPLVLSSLTDKPSSYSKLRHIRFAAKMKPMQTDIQKYRSIKHIQASVISFSDELDRHMVLDHNFKAFSGFFKQLLNRRFLTKTYFNDNVILNHPKLRALLFRSSQLRDISITIGDHEESVLPYLKQVQSLSIVFTKPIEDIIHSHHNLDPLGLLKLENLRSLKIIIPNDCRNPHESSKLKLQPKDLAHLLTIFSHPNFKAKVSISTPEFISRDKATTVIPNFKGATHVTSLNLGCVDVESLAFIIRDFEAFTMLKNLSLKLKISKKNEYEYIPLFPFFAALRNLRSLNILFMLPFFHFNAQDLFINLKLPVSLTSLAMDFYPIAFCPLEELKESHFNYFNKELATLNRLENFSLRLIVSSNMPTCYKWVSSFPPNIGNLRNLNLQLGYHVQPKGTENAFVSDIVAWTSQLKDLERIKLLLDHPNFTNLDKLVGKKDCLTMSNLRKFIFKIPEEKTFEDDGFSAESLGYLLKTFEGSYDKLELLDILISSPNFNEECFGILLHKVSQMRKLKEFDCNVHEGKFKESVFQAFEEGVKSLDSLDEINVKTDVHIKDDEPVRREAGNVVNANAREQQQHQREGVMEKISHILNWGY